ncbi:MAG TPA: hypothetical protein VFK57_25395 [Vicinamibacterales bacterium]|nr:hypothetical protein [Vicinamibacterales bacterium]
MSLSATPSVLDPRWLVNKRFDIVFVLIGAVLVSALCFALVALGSGFAVLAVGFAIVLDFPHVMQTYVRIWMDAREAKVYGRGFLTSLALIAACATYLYAAGEVVLLIAVWIYWQPFHVLKQHIGITRIYNAKNGYRSPSPLADYTLWLGCVSPILARIFLTGLQFDEYIILGRRLPFSNLTIPTPPVSGPVVILAYALLAGCTVLLLREQWLRARRGQPTMAAGAAANLALAVVSYNVAYLFVSNLYATILIASSVHSLQYHAICWSYNHRRTVVGGDDRSARVLAYLSRREALPMYVAFMLVLGGVCAVLELFADGLIPLIIVLHHFYFDGLIWKPGTNADLKVGLGLTDARPA